MSDAPTPAIPAATLIVLRDRPNAPPEILMVERARSLVFAGGALVFPGGRIDPDDHRIAEGFTFDDAAARIAAIRETIEETGIAIGLSPMPDEVARAILRDGLHEGRPFSELLADGGFTLTLEPLTPFARWCPAQRLARRFDATFYLAKLPDNAPPPVEDRRESTRAFWTTAEALLSADDAGEISLVFPTRRTIERLALFATFDDVVVDAARHPVRTIVPWEEMREGVTHLCIPADAGYPRTSAPIDTTRRE